jgi:beta-glucosidase
VVQLCVHEREASVKRPARELRGFQRVALKAKEKKAVTFTLPVSELAFYDVVAKKFVVKPGAFDVIIGSSSEDIRLRDTAQVKGRAKWSPERPAESNVVD